MATFLLFFLLLCSIGHFIQNFYYKLWKNVLRIIIHRDDNNGMCSSVVVVVLLVVVMMSSRHYNDRVVIVLCLCAYVLYAYKSYVAIAISLLVLFGIIVASNNVV